MHLVKLPIGNETAVQGTFVHTARMVGDALLYGVVRDPKAAPYFGATGLPDQGDNQPPGVEVQWPVLAGLTSQGRMVVVFRSGEQGPSGWTGKSVLYAAIGAASPLREPGQSIVVETTRPGPPGPKGDKGDIGPQGPPGPAGAPGQGGDVTEEEMRKLAELVAERVFALPPAGDHFGLPEHAQYGTRFQEMLAVMIHQGLMQHVIMAVDEAAANLLAHGYKPRIG